MKMIVVCVNGGFFGQLLLLMESINLEIRAFLEKGPTDAELTDFINNLTPMIKPTVKFHQLDPHTLTSPTLVYAHLMVQDIRDDFFFYSFIMKRPFSQDGAYFLYRFGNKPQQLPHQQEDELLENEEFMKVMSERTPLMTVPVRYQTEWVDKLYGNVNSLKEIELYVDGRADFKLG